MTASKNGLTKQDKANVTRFTRDLVAHKYDDAKHLSVRRVRDAIMENEAVRNVIIDNGAFAMSVDGFEEDLERLVEAIPEKQTRTKRTPEEKAKDEKKRRDAILETAQDGPVNAYSLTVLKGGYLRGLKEEERTKARAKFERTTKDVLG